MTLPLLPLLLHNHHQLAVWIINRMTATTRLPKMTDYNHNHHQQILRCPNYRKQIKIDELYEYLNTHPESKKEAIEHEPK
jgi:hypothetical protein